MRALLCSLLLTCVACSVEHRVDCKGSSCSSGEGAACLLRQGTLDTVTMQIGESEGPTCIWKSVATQEHSTCQVYWAFDVIELANGHFIGACDVLPYLEPVDLAAPEVREFARNRRGATVCRLKQVSGPGEELGWYFSDPDAPEVPGLPEICFSTTPGLAKSAGIEVFFMCSGAQSITRTDELVASDPDACSLPEDSARFVSAVGDTCLPPLPLRGFVEYSAYVQTQSPECETGACLVYQLDYDPDCGEATPDPHCWPERELWPSEVEKRSHCSCRCDAPAGDPGALCRCQKGFSCVPILYDAPPGVRGSYCVRNDAVGVF